MDDIERKVVRWRKPTLSEKVKVTDDLLIDLKDNGLITAEVIKAIEREQSPQSKVLKLLDAVLACQEPTTFATFLFVMSKDNGWAVKDIEMDLRMERGLLEIDDEIQTEAKMLVHKKFGTSKRLCETDKKDIADLIAAKLQIQKEEWDREKGDLEGELKRLNDSINGKDSRSQAIAKQVRDFIHSHDKQLTTHAHGMSSTTQALRSSLDDMTKDMLSKIERSLKHTLDRLDKILKHRDQLLKEREECLRITKCPDDKASLNEAVRSALEKASQPSDADVALKKAAKVTGDKDLLIKRLNTRITQLEDDIMEMEDKNKPKGNGLASKTPQEATTQHHMTNGGSHVTGSDKLSTGSAKTGSTKPKSSEGSASSSGKKVVKKKPKTGSKTTR